jgi:hypothetical protein
MKIIIYLALVFNISYSQDCGEDLTYFETLPTNCYTDDINQCFHNDDIAVINELISINSLSYDSPLEVGVQTWLGNRLFNWVVTFTPTGSNGIDQQLSQLPDNIGQLSELRSLFIEKHDLTELPDSFTMLANLKHLYISNNWLTSLPQEFGDLTNLETLDLGYNQLVSIPESIGDLENIVYLFLFNNQLSFVPETICDLDLDWDGISPANYPYFASGGNHLCDSELIPDCVENSANFNISMEQNYYSFLIEAPQICEAECPNLGDLNGDGGWNVLDIVTLANCVLANNCAELENSCAGDLNGDGGYNVLDIVTLANCVLANNCGG